MLFQALHVEIETKNLNLQVTLLRQKVWEPVPHIKKKRVGNAFPPHYTPGYDSLLVHYAHVTNVTKTLLFAC